MDRGGCPDGSVRARGTTTALTAGAILQAASRAGLDTAGLVTNAGLTGVDLDDFTVRITTEQLLGLWEQVMRQAADPSLPVRAAQLSFPKTRNQAALSAMTTATLQDALLDAAALSGSWTTTYTLVVRQEQNALGLGLDGLGIGRLGERCETEFILAYILNAARVALGTELDQPGCRSGTKHRRSLPTGTTSVPASGSARHAARSCSTPTCWPRLWGQPIPVCTSSSPATSPRRVTPRRIRPSPPGSAPS